MITLITYTDDRMTISATKLVESALNHGATSGRIYRPEDLDADFREKMKEVLACERGAGFYCWKPYVIEKALSNLADGEYLVWCDAGTEVIGRLPELIAGMDDDILFFSNGWRHIEWCKMDLIKYCFTLYGDPNDSFSQSTVDNAEQVQASHIVFKKTEDSLRLVRHWLELATIPHLIDNSPSELPNVLTFQEHRWDQSILCCLQLMYNYRLHWFPTTTAMHLKKKYAADRYPAIFLHHRKRNDEWNK